MKPLDVLRHPSRYKYRTYLFLNRPQSCLEISYQIILALLVLACIIFTMYAQKAHENILFGLDLLLATIFAFEFLVQVWSSTSLPRYQHRHIIHILLNPICLLDLFIIISTVTGIIFGLHENLISVGLRGFRILQFFEHRYHLWRLVGSVLWTGRFQLAVCLYFSMMMVISVSFLIYLVEKPANTELATLGQSMWFTLVTFTTVGFGDVVPSSVPGKIVTAISLVIGTSIFALPAGIIGAGLALKVEKEETIRGTVRENYAARLIQNAWHFYWAGRQKTLQEQNMILIESNSNLNHKLKSKYNTASIQFSYLLKFIAVKARFKKSLNLLSSSNLHELYTSNYMEQNEKIRSLQLDVRHLKVVLTEVHRLMLLQNYPFDQTPSADSVDARMACKVSTSQSGERMDCKSIRTRSGTSKPFKRTVRKMTSYPYNSNLQSSLMAISSPARQWRARYLRRCSTTDLL